MKGDQMSNRQAKRIRREINRRYRQNAAEVWVALCALPLRRRARLAWRLLVAKRGGAA